MDLILKKQLLEIYERLPPVFRYGASFIHWSNFLSESEFWDNERIKNYQISQLKKLLKYSMEYIPYYKKLFADYGLKPDNIKNLEDLKLLPLLDKETIRDKSLELINRKYKKVLKRFTSGSTGIPLTIYLSREAVKIYHALLFNSFKRIGYKHGDRVVNFWNMIDIGKRRNLPCVKIGNKLIFSNRYLTDEWLLKYLVMMNDFKPEFITGYPSVLSVLAAFMKNRGLTLQNGKLKAVICHGETFSDWQRNLIKEIFKTRVFSVYSMTEGSLFSSECEYSLSQHIYPQSGYVELIEIGSGYNEVVATGFINYAMPLIRYKTGDIVSLVRIGCNKCGRKHQLFRNVEGRINDFLISRDGTVIPRIMPWIKIFPNTKQYQFFQQEPGKASLRIVRDRNYSESDTQFIRWKLNEMLGLMRDTIDIEIEFTDDIPRSSSSKLNLVDQRLNVRDFLNV